MKAGFFRRWAIPAATRAYRAALGALPPGFATEWAKPMSDLFARRSVELHRRRGPAAVLAWWCRAALDLAATGVREWLDTTTTRRRPGRGGEEGAVRGFLDACTTEVRQAARSLRRSPGFSLAVVAVLAAGVGANAGMFELADRFLFRPPLFLRAPDAVHRLHIDRQIQGGRVQDPSFSWPTLQALLDGSGRDLDVVGVFDGTLFFAAGDEVPRPRPVKGVSAGYFELFDAQPALGRFLGADDARPDAPPAAVLAYGFWNSELGRDPGVLGRTIQIGQRTYTVAGVAPAGFLGEGMRQVLAFVPLGLAGADIAGPEFATRPGTTWIEILVRRPDTMPLAAAAADVERTFLAWAREAWSPAYLERSDPRVLLAPVLRDRGPHRSEAARISVWLLGMSAVVLLLACVNVATLMLGRAVRRARDAGVRTALGVSRRRLMAGPLAESLILSVLAGLVAVPAAQGLVVATSRVLLDPEVVTPGLSLRSLILTAVAVAVAGVLTGAAPSLSLMRRGPAQGLRSGARAGRDRGRMRAQRGLVATQAALSTVLLLAAGLFGRSLARVASLDLGYDPERVVLVSSAARSPLADAATIRGGGQDRERIMATLRESAGSAPGVASTALTATVPFLRNSFERIYRDDGTPALDGTPQAAHVVSGGYFETMGTRIVRGRGLRDTDDGSAPPVTVLSEGLAAALWPGEEALGRCVRLGIDTMPCFEVVGVAQGIRRGEFEDDAMRQFYVPWPQYYYGIPAVVAVRTEVPAATLVEPLRRRLQDAVGDAAYVRLDLLSDRIAIQTRSWRLGAAVFTAFGLLALALASFGLFSVVAYDVSQRRREFGVRTALGARREDLLALVVRTGLWAPVAGVAAGLVLAWAWGRPVEALLFGISAHDPATFAGVAVLLSVSAAAATLLPAWRAARVAPRTALEGD